MYTFLPHMFLDTKRNSPRAKFVYFYHKFRSFYLIKLTLLELQRSDHFRRNPLPLGFFIVILFVNSNLSGELYIFKNQTIHFLKQCYSKTPVRVVFVKYRKVRQTKSSKIEHFKFDSSEKQTMNIYLSIDINTC